MFDLIYKPKQSLIDICNEDNEDKLIIILDNMISKANKKDPNDDIYKEKILNNLKNRWLTNYCIDNKKWKTLKVLINYRILVTGQISKIEESIANNYNILTIDQINDLKNLLIALKIYRNYNVQYINPTTYQSNHPYIHLLYAGGFNNSDILSNASIVKLDTILVNNLIDKINNSTYTGLYINIDIDNTYEPTYEKLEYLFCNNKDDCITLFNNIHSIDITKWTSSNIFNIEKLVKTYYDIQSNRKKFYNLSKPIYYHEKYTLL